MLFATTITIVNVPYLALTPSLTLDSHERSVVTGIRVVFGIVGALAAAGAHPSPGEPSGRWQPVGGIRTDEHSLRRDRGRRNPDKFRHRS